VTIDKLDSDSDEDYVPCSESEVETNFESIDYISRQNKR